MKKMIYRLLGCVWMVASLLSSTSCSKYDYTDELQDLGKRVEWLENQTLEINKEIALIQQLMNSIEQRGYITSVKQNEDGTSTIIFNNGKSYTLRNGRQGEDGEDGKPLTLQLAVAQDPVDGLWYWTLGSEWLLNGAGERMRAGAADGEDGKESGVTGAIVPQMRIDTVTRCWQISTDGGATWQDTGVKADGEDGKDGVDAFVVQLIPSQDGKYVTFVFNNGIRENVPVLSEENE